MFSGVCLFVEERPSEANGVNLFRMRVPFAAAFVLQTACCRQGV